jgi:hypothetical protein
MSRFQTLLLAAIAGTVVLSSQAAQAAPDSVTLMPSLVGTSPTSLQGNVLFVYGAAGAGAYNIQYSVAANLASGEGFGSVSTQFVPGTGVTPGAYTADGNAVWTITNAGGTTINNTYGPNNDLVASIGAYTSAIDPTRAAFAQAVTAPVGTLAVNWDGVTNNATLKMTDTTGDGVLGQIQYQTDNLSSGQLNAGVDAAGGSQVQFIDRIPGDANGDGKVNGLDVSVIAGHWQQHVTGGANVGDFNGDGIVNALDVSVLAGHWQASWTTGLTPATDFASPAVAAAPEPASLGVLAIGAVALLSRRKKA